MWPQAWQQNVSSVPSIGRFSDDSALCGAV